MYTQNKVGEAYFFPARLRQYHLPRASPPFDSQPLHRAHLAEIIKKSLSGD